MDTASKCCLSWNDIFPSEKDSKNRLLGYIWKVTHLQCFQSLSPQILKATDQFTPFKAKHRVLGVIRAPRSPMCSRIKSTGKKKKRYVESWIYQPLHNPGDILYVWKHIHYSNLKYHSLYISLSLIYFSCPHSLNICRMISQKQQSFCVSLSASNCVKSDNVLPCSADTEPTACWDSARSISHADSSTAGTNTDHYQ